MNKQSKPSKQSPNATIKKKSMNSSNSSMKNQSTPLDSLKDETNLTNSKTDRSGNDPSLSTSKNSATTAKEKQGTGDKKSIRFNVAHILFLHGLLKTFYNMPDLDKKMSEFVHDLTLVFEIYLEDCEVPEELAKHFNYSPLKED